MAATAVQAMRTLLLRTACSLHPRRIRGNPKPRRTQRFVDSSAARSTERPDVGNGYLHVSKRASWSFGRSPARTGHGRVIDVGEVGEQVESESSIASLPCAVRCWQ